MKKWASNKQQVSVGKCAELTSYAERLKSHRKVSNRTLKIHQLYNAAIKKRMLIRTAGLFARSGGNCSAARAAGRLLVLPRTRRTRLPARFRPANLLGRGFAAGSIFFFDDDCSIFVSCTCPSPVTVVFDLDCRLFVSAVDEVAETVVAAAASAAATADLVGVAIDGVASFMLSFSGKTFIIPFQY